jgi:ankyrin repeat protein
MVELFLDHGAQIQGAGALILAARTGKEENVKCPLNRGVDVNEMAPPSDLTGDRENVGFPLHNAVDDGNIGVVDVLLKARADVTLKGGKGRTAAEIARQKGMDAAILARLSSAVKGERLMIILVALSMVFTRSGPIVVHTSMSFS